MEDVVCVKVIDRKKGTAFVMTWGRVFDQIDPKPFFAALRHGVLGFGLQEIKSMHLCYSLADGANETYFYEAMLYFAHRPIPFGRETYPKWAKKMWKSIETGKEIYLITDLNRKSRR